MTLDPLLLHATFYIQKLIVVNLAWFDIEELCFKNSALMIEFRLLIGIRMSGVMIGRICLNMVT